MSDESSNVRLRGPIAYLHRDTTDGRRVESLTWKGLPLTLAWVHDHSDANRDQVEVEVVGTITNVTEIDGTVWAEASVWPGRVAGLGHTGLVGTRFGVGVDVVSAVVVYVDQTGNEVDDITAAVADPADLTAVFESAELIGVTVNHNPAWPDAYLEAMGPAEETA